MPLRRVGNDNVRDPYQPGSDAYVAHPDSIRQVLAWYEGERAEYPNRDTPDLWMEVARTENDGRGQFLLMHRVTNEVLEVTYRIFQGVELGYEVRALPPEEAYKLALDQDELHIAHGERLYNERHPQPSSETQ